MTTLYISRRYSEYASHIQSLLDITNIQYVDYTLKCNNIINDLAIIVMSEDISDRRSQQEWLSTITKNIRANSKKVCVIMFSLNPNKHMKEYNTISDNMIVYCVYETVNDEVNKESISAVINNQK